MLTFVNDQGHSLRFLEMMKSTNDLEQLKRQLTRDSDTEIINPDFSFSLNCSFEDTSDKSPIELQATSLMIFSS